MKRLVLIILSILPITIFAQVDKIGFTKSELLNSMQNKPCKTSETDIWFCSNNGSLINYNLTNDRVSSVLYMWEYDTIYSAEKDVAEEIDKNSKIYGKPTIKDGGAFWFYKELLIMVKYGLTNGKHYSCWRVSIYK